MKKLMLFIAVMMLAAYPCRANAAYDDLVKLVKAEVDEDVIIAYIGGSAADFSLSPEAIIQLKSLGASDKVITAAIQHKGSAADTAVSGTGEPGFSSIDSTTPPPQAAATTPPAVVYETVPQSGGWVYMDNDWYWRNPGGVIIDFGLRLPLYHRHHHWIAQGYRGYYRGDCHRSHRGRR